MSLKDKLKKDLRSKKQSEIDWDKRKSDWINSVNELNQQIQDWFSDFKDEGLLEFKLNEKSNSEEYIGLYKVNELHLCFANGKEVVIEPMGTLIIGAWARFDVYARGYNSGKYYILRYKDEEGNYTWNIVNPDNRKNVEPLTKEVLEQIFDKWLS